MRLPIINVGIPSGAITLEFVKNSGFEEEFTISSENNFVEFDISLLEIESALKDDDYNAKYGTDYKLLQAEYYRCYRITNRNMRGEI